MAPERFLLRRPLRALPLPLLLLAACGRAAPDEQAAVNTKGEGDPKGQAAAVFYERYVAARRHREYVRQKNAHTERYENS